MTEQQARQKENDVLNALIKLGYHAAGAPFALRGGALAVEPHPELPMSWWIIWKPHDKALLTLDFSKFSTEAAAEQIGRYNLTTYAAVRRRFETMIAELRAAGIAPIFEEHCSPDTFFAGAATLAIHSRLDSRREPEYFIEMADDMPREVADGEETPECRWIEVTNYEPTALIELFKSVRA